MHRREQTVLSLDVSDQTNQLNSVPHKTFFLWNHKLVLRPVCCQKQQQPLLSLEKSICLIERRSIFLFPCWPHTKLGALWMEEERCFSSRDDLQTHNSNPNCSTQEKEKVIFYARELWGNGKALQEILIKWENILCGHWCCGPEKRNQSVYRMTGVRIYLQWMWSNRHKSVSTAVYRRILQLDFMRHVCGNQEK